MKIKLMTLLFTAFFILKSGSVQALEKVGSASLNYSEIGSYMLNKDIIHIKAKKLACKNAFKKYIASFDSNKKSNYQRVQLQIEDSLDLYMTCSKVVDKENDSDNQIYNIAVKANIDVNKVEEVINSSSKIMTEGSESDIAIMMVTRTVVGVKRKDDKRVDVYRETGSATTTTSRDNKNSTDSQFLNENEKTVDTDQTEAVGDAGASISSRTSGSGSGSSSTDSSGTSDTTRTTTNIKSGKVETGGSTTISTPTLTYRIADGNEDAIEGNMEMPLINGGFELIGLDDFSDEMLNLYDETKRQFADSDKLDKRLLGKIKKAFVADEIDCFVTGTFDVGQTERDAATGQYVINVSVKAARTQCYKARKQGSKKRWRRLAVVAGVQAKGLGSSVSEATNNGISSAAQKVGKKLLSSLNAKGVN